mgnify:CR=1 FL=1
MYDVAFAMNHASAHKVTEEYVKPDYSIVSELNRKVIDFVFYDKLPDLLEDDVDVEQTQFRISFKNMVRGTVFFQEKKIYSFEDLHRNGNLLGKPFICSKITVTTLLAMPYFVKSKNL